MNDHPERCRGRLERHSFDTHRDESSGGRQASPNESAAPRGTIVDWTRPCGKRRIGLVDRRKPVTLPAPQLEAPTSEQVDEAIATARQHQDIFPRGDVTTAPAERTEVETTLLALNHVGCGVQMIDHTGRVVVFNQQAAEMLGVTPEFLASKPLFVEVVEEQFRRNEFSACPPEVKAELLRQLVPRQPQVYRRHRPDGRVVEVSSIPLAEGGVVRTHTDITDRWEAEQRVKYMAHHDFLTGLANRARFQEEVDIAIGSAGSFAVLLIDIDFFKRVNDTHGHHFGDALLTEVGNRLRTTARSEDLVARLGGDELALLVRDVPDASIGERIANAIITVMEHPFEESGKVLVPSVSVGVVTISREMKDPDERRQVIWRADLALYSAKAAGRGRWHAFDPAMAQRELSEQALLTEIRVAIAKEQLEVFYQPVVEVASNEVAGFEALIRWRHPTRGLLPAGEFLPTLESTGLIVQVGQWVLGRACRDAMHWPEHVRVLVNLSPRQLSHPGLMDAVTDALHESGLSSDRLELEITETSMMQTSGRTEATIQALRNLGIRIALDDFGTGYSSLSHISTLHFDTIKIDRSFVTDAAERVECAAVVRAVASIARDLSIGTVAEGVETQEQLAWIRNLGCSEAQGFLFSKPLPLEAATAMVGGLMRDAARG